MKELYNAPEVDIIRFAPAMAIADDGDITSNKDLEDGDPWF